MQNEIVSNNKYKEYVFFNSLILIMAFLLANILYQYVLLDNFIYYIVRTPFSFITDIWFKLLFCTIISVIIDYCFIYKILKIKQKIIKNINNITKVLLVGVFLIFMAILIKGFIFGIEICFFSCSMTKGLDALSAILFVSGILVVPYVVLFIVIYFISNLIIKKIVRKGIAKTN